MCSRAEESNNKQGKAPNKHVESQELQPTLVKLSKGLCSVGHISVCDSQHTRDWAGMVASRGCSVDLYNAPLFQSTCLNHTMYFV